MTVSQKVALSLLISVVLAAGFSVLAFTGFFNLIETRFYNPSITNSLKKEVERDAAAIQGFFDELRDRFFDALSNDAVKRSFLPNQSAGDIFERTRVFGQLRESQQGIQSVRFVDAGGLRIHFSTSSADILNQSPETITYKNYDEVVPFVPYQDMAVPSGGDPKTILDQKNERIVFSFPFYDSMEVYRGTVFYSLSIRAIADRLTAEGRIKIGENFSVVSNPPGMVSGLPYSANEAEALVPVISSIWNEGLLNLTALDSARSGSVLALISAKTSQGFLVGRVMDESLFAFPQSMRVILLSAIFLTLFLSIFLAFNLRPDTMTVVQNRLKNLQLSLIREYYERKGEMDWNHWYRELEQRREDVRTELKRGVKEKPGLLEDIDSLIDKSWDEILTAIGGKRETHLAIDEDKLQNILNRMLLAAGNSPVLPGGGPPAPVMPFVQPAASTQTSDATEEVLEELGEVEELGDEAAEELEELEELSGEEEPEDIDELSENKQIVPPLAIAADKGAKTAAASPQNSNIEIVFGDNDIPTIVETSGLDLVDDLSDETVTRGETEELEEFEGLESAISSQDLASKIEFDSSGTLEEDADPDTNNEFVIVSPFSSLLSKFDDEGSFNAADGDNKKVKTSGRLEELDSGYSMSLVHKPFQNEDTGEPVELPVEGPGVIKQRNGVHYVDEKAKKPDPKTSKSLDPGLKNLVDSVIKK